MKKAIPYIMAAGLLIGTAGCTEKTEETIKQYTNKRVDINDNINIDVDSLDNHYISEIPVEKAEYWKNIKLVGKDNGKMYFRVGTGIINYQYGEYLFRAPTGEEITAIGKEEAMFIGENYNIELYRFKPGKELDTYDLYKVLLNGNISKHNDFLEEKIDEKVDGILTRSEKLRRGAETR